MANVDATILIVAAAAVLFVALLTLIALFVPKGRKGRS